MSKREPTGTPLTDAEHASMLSLFPLVHQSTNDESMGGSQVWFDLGGVTYRATFEKCAGPLRDLSGKAKLYTEKDPPQE